MISNPVPPWEQPAQGPIVQVLKEAGVISLETDTTHLSAAVGDPPATIEVTLPDGNYERQTKRILVPGSGLDTTETFEVSGAFVGFAKLRFNSLGSSALLHWDGTAWHLIGGNAETLN